MQLAATRLETILKRDRVVVLSGIVAIAALVWAYTVHLAGDMGNMAMPTAQSWGAVDFATMFVMWLVMMVLTAAPMILLFANVNRKHREQQGPFVPTRVFLLGYVVAWAAFAALATVANWGLHSGGLLSSMMGENTSSYLGGGLLLAAGAFQWSRLKSVCLTHCRTPMGFLMTGWRDGVGGARSILSGMLLGPDDPIVCPGGDEPRLDSRAVRLRPFREDRPGWPSAKPRYRPCADRLGRVRCSPE